MSRKIVLLLVLFVVNVIFSCTFCYIFCVFYKHYYDVNLRSSVKAPIRFFLFEIQQDFSDGKYDSAQDKVYFLNQEWERFYISNGYEYDIGNLLVRWQQKQNQGNQEEQNDDKKDTP
ncbi:MAG: hypothetical protein WC340_17225 [Kiritimatiellia bacterium]